MRTTLGVGLVVVGLSACVSKRDEPSQVDPAARTDLRAAFGVADVTPVGFAMTPDGSRFIFDENLGLFRIDGDVVTEIVGMTEMPNPGPTQPIELPFTDLVAMSPTVFAITAIGDGFLLDTEAMTLTQHFCYVPGGFGEGGTVPTVNSQRTDAIAYNAATNRIYAQPRSFDAAGTFIRSELSKYDSITGEDLLWTQTRDDVASTAMLIDGAHLLVGQDSRIERFVASQYGPNLVEDLARFGVESIDGMAFDTAANTLVLVDKSADALFEIDLADLDLTGATGL